MDFFEIVNNVLLTDESTLSRFHCTFHPLWKASTQTNRQANQKGSLWRGLKGRRGYAWICHWVSKIACWEYTLSSWARLLQVHVTDLRGLWDLSIYTLLHVRLMRGSTLRRVMRGNTKSYLSNAWCHVKSTRFKMDGLQWTKLRKLLQQPCNKHHFRVLFY